MRERLGYFSVREKNLWFELLLDVVVAVYYYPRAFALILRDSAELTGTAVVDLLINTVILAILVSALLSVLLHTQKKPEPKDERDFIIDAKCDYLFSRMMMFGVLFVMGWIVMQQFNPWPERNLFELTPLVIAHVLLFVVMISSMAHSVMKLLLYRLGP